jgi:hypothetical protein
VAKAGFRTPSRGDTRVPVRNKDVKGPLDAAGDWVREHGGSAAGLGILAVPNAGDLAYEIVNLIDGTRSVAEIRDAVSAEFSPLDVAVVSEYLDLLAKTGAVSFR